MESIMRYVVVTENGFNFVGSFRFRGDAETFRQEMDYPSRVIRIEDQLIQIKEADYNQVEE